jgi:hypothetical protein
MGTETYTVTGTNTGTGTCTGTGKNSGLGTISGTRGQILEYGEEEKYGGERDKYENTRTSTGSRGQIRKRGQI